jgi:hypothetical protein
MCDSPGCETPAGGCYLEYLPTGYTIGTCSVTSTDPDEGCSETADNAEVNTTTYMPGTCNSSCVCVIPSGTQSIADHGYGKFCYQDCCTPPPQ